MKASLCSVVFDIQFDVAWLRKIHAHGVVIGRRILFSAPAMAVEREIFRHELEHAYQQIRVGRLVFYSKYFYYSMRYGYFDNPYEIEARERAVLPLTKSEEELLWRLREGSTKLQEGSLHRSK